MTNASGYYPEPSKPCGNHEQHHAREPPPHAEVFQNLLRNLFQGLLQNLLWKEPSCGSPRTCSGIYLVPNLLRNLVQNLLRNLPRTSSATCSGTCSGTIPEPSPEPAPEPSTSSGTSSGTCSATYSGTLCRTCSRACSGTDSVTPLEPSPVPPEPPPEPAPVSSPEPSPEPALEPAPEPSPEPAPNLLRSLYYYGRRPLASLLGKIAKCRQATASIALVPGPQNNLTEPVAVRGDEQLIWPTSRYCTSLTSSERERECIGEERRNYFVGVRKGGKHKETYSMARSQMLPTSWQVQ